MLSNKVVSLILPCKNEEKALKALLGRVPRQVDEIIVVNNDSTDHTAKVASKYRVKVLTEPRNENGIGYGYAIAQGIKNATGDIIICMDGDDSYPIKSIARLVRELERKNLDFISCSRLPFKDSRKMSRVRMLGVRILNLAIFLLFGIKIKDSLSGMWVFRRKIVPSLTLFEGGWNFSLEIKLNAITDQKVKFSEHPIPYHDRMFDSSKQNIWETGFKHLLFLIKTRFNYTMLTSFLLLTKKNRVPIMHNGM